MVGNNNHTNNHTLSLSEKKLMKNIGKETDEKKFGKKDRQQKMISKKK